MNKIVEAVNKHRERILGAERYLWANPETGYREQKGTEYLARQYRELGYELCMAEGITGFYTVLDTGRPGPEILILGELDSIICPSHKEADPTTGAVHACGHHAQSAALLGIAAALKEPGMLDGLCGRIRLCAVPAEELLEMEYRSGLKAEGKIRYFGGKTEFLSRGYFDGVDMAFMVHTGIGDVYSVNLGHIGCLAKSFEYKGKAAHAGGAPHNGINALYAASCGLNAINAIRETFRDSDHNRVHPIVTAGGDVINVIPDRVRLETHVRGGDFDSMLDVNRRVNRALVGAALSLGANVEIVDSPGYAPHRNDPNMIDAAEQALSRVLPDAHMTRYDFYSTGSTDMGDLSQIMPVVHPNCGGGAGIAHGDNYYIADPERACLHSAMWQISLLFLLLEDGAKRAKEIIASYKPPFANAKEYLAFVDKIASSGDRVTYTADGAVTVF